MKRKSGIYKRSVVLRHFVWLVVLLASGVLPAAADDADTSVVDLEPIVVTARGTACPVSLTPGGVGVVDEEEIERVQPVSITDVTERIPGVEKTSDSPWGSDINIRGLGRNNVIFLVDGFRVNTATDINARFGLVNPDDIERIEVLKGPFSALYGSGSMGGVVNVITRKGGYSDDLRKSGQIKISGASNPQGAGVYAFGAGESSRGWLTAAGAYRDYDDREAADHDTIHNSGFRDDYAKLAGGFRWNDANETTVNFQQMEGHEVGIPGKGLSLPEGPDATYPRTSRVLYALTHAFAPDASRLTESKIDLYLQEIQRRVRLDNFPATMPLERLEPGADHRTLGLKWTNRIDLGAHRSTLGIDLWQWEVDGTERYRYFKNGLTGIDSSLGEVSQLDGGCFMEDDWRFSERVVLNIGGRLDFSHVKSDDLYNWIEPPSALITPTLKREGETTDDVSWQGHLGMTWQFADQWSATAIAASSYRPPDLMDRFKYINLGSGVELFGNPDLDPERSSFFETGLHYVSGRLRFSASAYANFLKDLIAEAAVSDTVRQMENVNRAEIFGGEMLTEWRIADRWSARADISYTHGRNKTEDEPLSYVAPLNGHVALRHGSIADGKWWVEAELAWAAEQDRVPDDQETVPGWQTVNLSAAYRFDLFGRVNTLNAAVTNLLDEEYRNALSTSRGILLEEPGIGFQCSWKIDL
ncbi:TonB-dependent receptor [uncultured Desulfosarcina sp.]|uniref:TonB-dependent receptor n=1 Tax=uncultured Desulfosarcina sp. TaxID=218289 RepID=UPI0029C95FFE|nr:TonB-dependent receptor [uncultured Desulfosarcina sp.]